MLGYDADDQLSSAPGVQMGYRADGLRAWKQTAGGRTYFLYDGDTLIGEVDGTSGQVTTTQTWGADGLLSRGGQFFVYDPTGNVAQRLDATGAVVSTALFSAYGLPVLASGVGSATAGEVVGYKGKWGYYTDGETVLILCSPRYYDPQLGRWLNRDPIGYDGGINLYGYVDNNPGTFNDPTGLSKDPMPGAGPEWVRFSVALFIPMPEFYSMHPKGLLVKHKGDGRKNFHSDTDADRIRVDFALNTRTGQIRSFAPHTAGSKMTYVSNGYSERATATIKQQVPKKAKRTGSGWQFSVSAQGWDPFYSAGGRNFAPAASFSAIFKTSGTKINGSVNYRDFPAMEIFAYNKQYQKGRVLLFWAKPKAWIQHGPGPGTLMSGEHNHSNF